MGQLLFSIYTSELFTVINSHLPATHCCADDTQLYLPFQPNDSAAQDSAMKGMDARLQDISLIRDRLMINDGKTEFVIIGTKAQLRKIHQNSLIVGECEVFPSDEAIRNLGVWIDNTFTLSAHIKDL